MRPLGVLLAAVLLAGCSGGKGGHVFVAPAVAPTTSAPVASATPPSSTPSPALLPAIEAVPLIVVHGITADPDVWDPFLDLYGPGRPVVRELYAREADALRPGDLPLAVVVNASYYRETTGGTKYDNGTSSIGGAPVARTDGNGGRYPVSYTERLGRIVEGVRRATGSDRVDLLCHSMGNLVGRAYIRWHSDGARGGKSKVRRYMSIAGPHRGVNAVEAYAVGFSRTPPEEFMRMGEIAELCGEYQVFGGKSFVEMLNDDWDGFCQRVDVTYGGASAIGAVGNQVDPNGARTTAITIATVIVNIVQGIINVNALADLLPFSNIFMPAKLVPEALEAFGPGDKVVRLAISRMDQPPFQRAVFAGTFEGRHEGKWNTEQSILGATFTAEVARRFCAESATPGVASVTSCDLVLVDAPGEASWLALDTVATGLASAQLVEETLDASGKPVGGAQGYGLPVKEGEQHAFFRVPAGAGDRRYRVVLYGANGPALTKTATFTLSGGAPAVLPRTDFAAATTTLVPGGAIVHATFSSNAADPTLAFSYRLDGGAWTPYAAPGTFDTPALGPGEHRLEARARHAANGARRLVEDARGAAVGLFVEASGVVTVRR